MTDKDLEDIIAKLERYGFIEDEVLQEQATRRKMRLHNELVSLNDATIDRIAQVFRDRRDAVLRGTVTITHTPVYIPHVTQEAPSVSDNRAPRNSISASPTLSRRKRR